MIHLHPNPQKKSPKTQWLWITLCLLLTFTKTQAQQDFLPWRLTHLPNVTATPIPNPQFPGGYWMMMVNQLLDHQDATKGSFTQRIYVGLQAQDAPVLLVTDGYAVDYAAKPDYQHELAATLNANQIVVEHRYFGKSQPTTIDYQYLTTQQAAADIHAIKVLLDSLFIGKWISTGTSKGGQAALAHRMNFPNDASATVLYGTAVKKLPSVTTSLLLKPVMETPCGQQVARFQMFAFEHKDSLFPRFISQVASQDLDFGDMELEVVYDYALLEFPFSFFQLGFTCENLPALTQPANDLVDFWMKVVPFKQYAMASRRRWLAAYYMFYHELGYYEYDLGPFQRYLKQAQYPNQFFAPSEIEITLDRTYLSTVRDFLDEPAAHSVFFIYGENDPWALQSVVLDNKYVVPAGNHKSKIADLPEELRDDLMRKILRCLR